MTLGRKVWIRYVSSTELYPLNWPLLLFSLGTAFLGEKFKCKGGFLSRAGTSHRSVAGFTEVPSDSWWAILLEKVQSMSYPKPCFYKLCITCTQCCLNGRLSIPAESSAAIPSFMPCGHTAALTSTQYKPFVMLEKRANSFEKLLGHLVIHQYSHQWAICPGQVQGHITILLRRALHFLGVWVREDQAEGLYRNISAVFFHQHPSHCHKTIPYHKSELTLLCGCCASLVKHIQCNILCKYDMLWSRENWHLQNFCNLIYCVISITFCMSSYILPDLQPILNYMNIKLLMQFHLPARRMIPILYFLFSQQGMKFSRTCIWWS